MLCIIDNTSFLFESLRKKIVLIMTTRLQRRNAISPSSSEAFILRTFSSSLNTSSQEGGFSSRIFSDRTLMLNSNIGKQNVGRTSDEQKKTITAPAA